MRLRWSVLSAVAGLFIFYLFLVLTIGYEGPVAIAVHFLRFTGATAVLVLYFRYLPDLFRQVPPPGRDYLIAGLLFTWSSNDSFSVWNEAGRLFGVDTSVFTSPISGFFSLMLVVAACFHLVATPSENKIRIIAGGIGVTAAVLLVVVAPLFR